MSTLEQALAFDPSILGTYRGRDVVKTSIAIQKAGDGLSQALAIEPQLLEIAEEHFVVLRCRVKRHEHEPIEDTDLLELKQVLVAEGATIVDAGLVASFVEEQELRIQRARDAAKGQGRLDVSLLERQHAEGAHAEELVDGCPQCQAERDAEEAGD